MPGSLGSDPASAPASAPRGPLAVAAGKLLFTAATNSSGSPRRLWLSTGSSAGTTPLGTVAAETADGVLRTSPLVNVNGTLYFAGKGTGSTGVQLWKSDGNASGTVVVQSFSSIDELINFNGTLYFVANDGTSGTELWRSNGTVAGTVLVRDIFPGSESSSPRSLTPMGANLYFSANSASGVELWRSNGTSGGTTQVKDIRPGAAGSGPANLRVIGRRCTFPQTMASRATNFGRAMVRPLALCLSKTFAQVRPRRIQATWSATDRVCTLAQTMKLPDASYGRRSAPA